MLRGPGSRAKAFLGSAAGFSVRQAGKRRRASTLSNFRQARPALEWNSAPGSRYRPGLARVTWQKIALPPPCRAGRVPCLSWSGSCARRLCRTACARRILMSWSILSRWCGLACGSVLIRSSDTCRHTLNHRHVKNMDLEPSRTQLTTALAHSHSLDVPLHTRRTSSRSHTHSRASSRAYSFPGLRDAVLSDRHDACVVFCPVTRRHRKGRKPRATAPYTHLSLESSLIPVGASGATKVSPAASAQATRNR